jgi:hypothetical protein
MGSLAKSLRVFLPGSSWLVVFFLAAKAMAAVPVYTVAVPEEFEVAGGSSLAFANSGSVAYTGAGSLKLNPGMLALEKQYSMGAAYHWPAFGREFYKLGVVDSQTSPVAAGVSYTSFVTPDDAAFGGEGSSEGRYVARRVGLGAAYAFRTFAAGVSGQWTEAGPPGSSFEVDTKSSGAVRGTSLNAGVVGLLTPSTRVGVSVEGLANKSVGIYSPGYTRVGIASLLSQGQTSVHLDWQKRELLPVESEEEQMVTGSFSIKIYDHLRLLGAYGKDPLPGHTRETAAAGISLVGPKFSFSYAASRPDVRLEEAHQAINLNLELSM